LRAMFMGRSEMVARIAASKSNSEFRQALEDL
jgi:hypothetical protein